MRIKQRDMWELATLMTQVRQQQEVVRFFERTSGAEAVAHHTSILDHMLQQYNKVVSRVNKRGERFGLSLAYASR